MAGVAGVVAERTEAVVVAVEEAIAAEQAPMERAAVVLAAVVVRPEADIVTEEEEARQATTGPTTKNADVPQCTPHPTCTKRVSSTPTHSHSTLTAAESATDIERLMCRGLYVVVESAAPRVLDVMEFAEVSRQPSAVR